MPEQLQDLMDELKDTSSETFYHSIHVKTYAYKMVRNTNKEGVTNYSEEEIEAICKGALLHDIGKMYVKNYILTKDSKLTDQERENIAEHTRFGFEAVEPYLTEIEYDIVKNICLYHHERYDGTGYERKTGLPIYVDIIAVCDVYDALTTNRVYRDAIESDKALEMIENGECGAFSEELIRYIRCIAE